MSHLAYDDDWGLRPRRGRGFGRWIGLILGLLILGVIATVLLNGPAIDQRPNDHKIIRVALPPPPPAPPPPKPIEKPVQVKTPPKEVEQPTTQTPPPTPAPQATPQASDALTARAGAGPSNYGLARGDGSGVRIGGSPGSNATFTAYAGAAFDAARRTAQSDPALTRDRYAVRVAVIVGPDGRVTDARILESSGDAKRDAEIQRVLLRTKTTPPPPGMPMPIRFELNTRSGS